MCDFGLANKDRFPAGTPAAKTLPVLTSTVSNLKELTAAQTSIENRLRELLRLKMEARSAVSNDIEFLYHTARAIASETPGFDEKFQMSVKGDPRLLNAARSAVKDAAALSAAF